MPSAKRRAAMIVSRMGEYEKDQIRQDVLRLVKKLREIREK